MGANGQSAERSPRDGVVAGSDLCWYGANEVEGSLLVCDVFIATQVRCSDPLETRCPVFF
jgi:hypothetical protein